MFQFAIHSRITAMKRHGVRFIGRENKNLSSLLSKVLLRFLFRANSYNFIIQLE